MRQSTDAFLKLSHPWFLARAVRTWKYGALFLPGLFQKVACSVSGCCSAEYNALILREMFWFVRNTWLDSGNMYCVSSRGF